MPPSTTISQRADISSQPPKIDIAVIKLSRHGTPLPVPLSDGMPCGAKSVQQSSL
jgi:hypothetical protein